MTQILNKTIGLQRFFAIGIQDALLLVALILSFIICQYFQSPKNNVTTGFLDHLDQISNEATELSQISSALSGDFEKTNVADILSLNTLDTFLSSEAKQVMKASSLQLQRLSRDLQSFSKRLTTEGFRQAKLPIAERLSQNADQLKTLRKEFSPMSKDLVDTLQDLYSGLPDTTDNFQRAKAYAATFSERIVALSNEIQNISTVLENAGKRLQQSWHQSLAPSDPMTLMNFSVFSKLILITIVVRFFLHYNGLCEMRVKRSYWDFALSLCQTLGESALLLSLIYLVFPGLQIGLPREIMFFILTFILLFTLVAGWRFLFDHIQGSQGFLINLAIFGTGPEARRVLQTIQERSAYRFVGFFSNDEVPPETLQNHSFLGKSKDLVSAIHQHQIDEVVIALSDHRGKSPTQDLLDAKLSGVKITNYTDFFERFMDKIPIENLNPSWIIYSDGFRKSQLQIILKRQMDLLFAILGLIVAFPVAVLVSILIRLDSRGSILYKQERLGQNGQKFNILKFRTMIENAEQASGPVWAQQNDPRVTRLGRYLRQSRIDEIPQMINVLKGEMSFVGPRPERSVFVEQLSKEVPFYMQRLTVKPGITGWAQVRYTYAATTEDNREKLMYDLYYIKHLSIGLDLKILFETIRVVLQKIGGW